MAEKNIEVDYDNEEDIMHISREGDKVKFSFDIELPNGDIVVDFGFDGRVVGLEFFDASGYFPFLKNIKENKIRAKMSVQYGANWAQINYEIMVPGEKPIVKEIISPYNKELILRH
jgi:uncharacterized protein YuzE